ncbi:MAG: hypothetical protein US51_C0022G0007, partial [Microgenomates group bacterium GW2011_GWA2_37_6]
MEFIDTTNVNTRYILVYNIRTMKPEISAVILAGGLGSRMGTLTTENHKSLLEVDGKPILHWILDGLQSEFGSARAIIATGYQGEKVRQAFGTNHGNIQIEYVHNPDHLGIRKRLLLTQGMLQGPFFVIGSDVLAHPSQYSNMVRTFEAHFKSNGVISGAIDLEPAPTHALIYIEGHRVVEIQTHPPFDYKRPFALRDMSLWFFHQKTMHLLKNAPDKESDISPILNEAIKNGAEYLIEQYYDNWYHFGHPEDLHAHLGFRDKRYGGK